MAKVTFVQPDGQEQILDVPDGTTLMRAARIAGIDGIIAECGGSAMCATCHVYVDESQLEWLPEMDAVEHEMLDSVASERRSNSRLSCQLPITEALDGLIVRLPPTQI